MYVIIAGGGALGREVATALIDRRHDVVVVDHDKYACDSIYAEIGAVTVHGGATNLHVLRDAGGERAALLITAMPSDADNIACALLGRSLGIERIIGRLRDVSYASAYEVAGVTHLIRSTRMLCNQVVLHVEHPSVEEIVSIGDDAAQIFSVPVLAGSWCAGRRVSEIATNRKFPRDCLLIGLRRAGSTSLEIPRGDTCVGVGDSILAIAAGGDIDRAVAILTRKG
ncbi:Trk system potassium uptake protein TrkA [Enhygromyxa salina]|uniref:Trk system potassium uptake protein TrkA n=1 Tax=Enhygromyxa salina TaxID=215803 RepID=A0A2S9XSL9_9BACT|nr:TrkA family potassium uptake protein [Enhygromyxa salina]PRP95859.1 Trk system potassium uptake protein TrkA [Enhygromyxa salina]